MGKNEFVKSSGRVFKDLGFGDVEARNLEFRSHLMSLLLQYIQKEKLTQKEAAERLGVSQPRVSNLTRGKIDLFSVGMLIDMMERAGFPVYLKIASELNQIFRKYEEVAFSVHRRRQLR